MLLCKKCGGSSICEHGRERSKCKECGGSGICEHGRQRSQCKECGGSSICEHGRQRSKCKECRIAALETAVVEVLSPGTLVKVASEMDAEEEEDDACCRDLGSALDNML